MLRLGGRFHRLEGDGFGRRFDLGLDRLGQLSEVTVIDGKPEQKLVLLRLDGEISDRPSDDGLLGPIPPTTSVVRSRLPPCKAMIPKRLRISQTSVTSGRARNSLSMRGNLASSRRLCR